MYKTMLFLFFLFNSYLYSQGVLAGTKIRNIAKLNYIIGSQKFSSKSNELVNTVDQIIDLTMACQLSGPYSVQVGEIDRPLPIIIENTGNGKDTFSLQKESENSSDVINKRIYLDDGDGLFSNTDTIISDITLNPDEKKLLFFVSDIPNSANWIKSKNGIKAISQTGGSGIRGTIYKLSDYYAVDGYKGGIDSSFCEYELNNLKMSIKKTSISLGEIYKGSKLKYNLEVSVSGRGTIENIIIEDNFPIGTTYVKNSVFLDGNHIDDSQSIDDDKLHIPLPNMVEGDIHNISFEIIVVK